MLAFPLETKVFSVIFTDTHWEKGMLEIYGAKKAVWAHHMDYIFNGFHFEMLLFNLWCELFQVNNDTQRPISFNSGEKIWVVAPAFVWKAFFNNTLIQKAIYLKI